MLSGANDGVSSVFSALPHIYEDSSKFEAGHMTYLTVLGRRMLIVNSKETALELLERRGAIYCDRYALSSNHYSMVKISSTDHCFTLCVL